MSVINKLDELKKIIAKLDIPIERQTITVDNFRWFSEYIGVNKEFLNASALSKEILRDIHTLYCPFSKLH